MQVQMLAQEFLLTPSLREHLDRSLRHAFAGVRGRLGRVVVRLHDTRDAGGRAAKVCEVSIAVPGRAQVLIRDEQDSMYYAIDCALRRAAHRAMRLLAAGGPRARKGAAPADQRSTIDMKDNVQHD